MATLRELTFDECGELLARGDVGRVAVAAPQGPQILPVNYALVGHCVVIRTSPYGVLGAYGDGSNVAFEVDEFDRETRTGWSVMVRGKATLMTDPDELATLRSTWLSGPWADGSRQLVLQIPLTNLTGRRLVDTQRLGAGAG